MKSSDRQRIPPKRVHVPRPYRFGGRRGNAWLVVVMLLGLAVIWGAAWLALGWLR